MRPAEEKRCRCPRGPATDRARRSPRPSSGALTVISSVRPSNHRRHRRHLRHRRRSRRRATTAITAALATYSPHRRPHYTAAVAPAPLLPVHVKGFNHITRRSRYCSSRQRCGHRSRQPAVAAIAAAIAAATAATVAATIVAAIHHDSHGRSTRRHRAVALLNLHDSEVRRRCPATLFKHQGVPCERSESRRAGEYSP